MILFYIFILISITPLSLHAEENFLPGFRSSVITDGKPILRGGGPEPEEEGEQADTDKTEVSREDAIARNSESRAMVDDVTVLIDYLMANYGYKIVNPTRRTDDNMDSGPLEEQFRSHSKNRKNKKNKKVKRKGSSHAKNKQKSFKENEVQNSSREKDTKMNIESFNSGNDFHKSGENPGNEDYNNADSGTRNQDNTDNVLFNEEASNRHHDVTNLFGLNFIKKGQEHKYYTNNDNVDGDPKVTSINLMNIVTMIRDEISSLRSKVQMPSILRMPLEDITDKRVKKNFSLAVSFQV